MNRYRAYVIWFLISLFLSNVFGNYSVLVFWGLQILFCVGTAYEIALVYECRKLENRPLTLLESIKLALFNIDSCPLVESPMMSTLLEEDSILQDNTRTPESRKPSIIKKPMLKVTGRSLSMNLDVKKMEQSARRVRSANNLLSRMSITDHYFLRRWRGELRLSSDLADDGVDSAKYMYGAMYACMGMIFWKNLWILCTLVVPVIYYILKRLSAYLGFSERVEAKKCQICQSIQEWYLVRHEALVPVPVRGLYRVAIIVDNRLTQILKSSIDTVTTTAVILTLVVFVLCGSTPMVG